jgi:pyruvate dehydrogenase E2 component (dihydrolipoamide acetyltransferase)
MTAWSFHLPDLGEGLKEAELVSWLVAVGDHVVEDQPLLTVETEKSLVEIPSPVAGLVMALHGSSGEILAVGTLLAEFDTEQRADSGAIVGELPGAGSPQGPPVSVPDTGSPASGVKAAPAVRAEAGRRGIDLATVVPSGREGSITLADLGEQRPAALEGEPLRGLRRGMARNMSTAWQQVAHATVTGSADIEAWAPGQATLPRLVRAIVAACAAEPALNAWFHADSETRSLHSQVDLGIATDTADGLLVPTLWGAEKKTGSELDASLQYLQDACARRALSPEELGGQTITVSNFGAIAGEYAQMIVVPPQVAIVGAGRARRIPVADGDNVQLRTVVPISVSFDHRVVSGGEAARFLKALISSLEQTNPDSAGEPK